MPPNENEILLEEKTEISSLLLEVTADQMEALLSLNVVAKGFAPEADEVLQKMRKAGIKSGIDEEAVTACCKQANEGKEQKKIVVASGIEPEPGPEGWIEFLVKVSSDQIDLKEDEFGRVDMRALNFFGNVEPGQSIARVHPPQNGDAGETVTGLPVPPVLGKPAEIRLGGGIRLEEDGALLVSEITGRVVHDGDTVTVTEEYSVAGDVDFSVGSVDFSGFVQIRGEVLDDFDVRGEKGIEIEGAIGACRIESEGNISIGSMAGKGEGKIICGGNLVARYLNEVTVECAGNVVVSNEIRNSVVKSSGTIVVENGGISGGTTVALAGVEAKNLGSTLGVHTKLMAGVYFPEIDRMEYLHNRLRSLNEQIVRINSALGPLNKKRAAGQSLGEAVLRRIEVLTIRLEELTEEKSELDREVANFRTMEHPTANPKINVRDTLQEGVVIQLGGAKEEVRLEMCGPLSIIENTREGGLRFLSMTPLAQKAEELEEECVEKADQANDSEASEAEDKKSA